MIRDRNRTKLAIATVGLTILLLGLGTTPALAPGAAQVGWTPGWDQFTQTLN